ncbi:cytochrome P450 [Xylariaceae sp. FL0594]|nr:cytochrome P450 [Xylariaceae sp. FL0594]
MSEQLLDVNSSPVILKALREHPYTVLGAIVIAWLAKAIYAHLTHPLYHFPGPFWASFSNVLHSWTFMGGRQPYDILALHEKYGPVVRTSPNELSFNTAQSWRDIYGFRPSHKTFVKSPFYDGGSFADAAHSIVSERDPTQHGIMRKYLSHAFSDRSLKEQEGLVTEMVDLFMHQIGKFGPQPGGVDIVMWFNLLTLDIIGSLAFGEPFGGLESANYHPWIQLVLGAMSQGALADCMTRFPLIGQVFQWLMPGTIAKLIEDTRKHEAHTIALVDKRLKNPSDRPDFLTRMLENRDKDSISDIQIAAHASDFVTAGSETTATVLSTITYHLLRFPDVYRKLKEEIRSEFQSYDQINAKSTLHLKYLNAVIYEGMRIYSPLPFALPRVVPEGGDTVDGHFIPGGVTVSTATVGSNNSTANFEKPFDFIPERWMGENARDKLDASQPFSLGPRGCLGRNLAWMEMNTTLAKLHFKYDIELLSKDLDWHRDSRMHTLWHKPRMFVQVMERKDL